MFFNDGSVSEDICLHLSLEKVYVTELNTSLALFQVGPLHNDTVMPLRFHANYLSLVALVCTLVCAQDDSTLKDRFEDTNRQIEEIEYPVADFEAGIQDKTQINDFDGTRNSCDCINPSENVDQQCPAITSCLDHVYSMTRYLSNFYELIDEFLSSPRETTFNATQVKCDLMNLKTSIINYTLEEISDFQPASISWQNFSCGNNIVNYATPEPDSGRLEVTCTDQDDCNLESKLGIGLLDWLSDMKESMGILANVTDEISDLQELLNICHNTSRAARSNKKGKKKGKNSKELKKKRQEKKKAKKAARIEKKKADKAARKAEKKQKRKEQKKQKRAQQQNEN